MTEGDGVFTAQFMPVIPGHHKVLVQAIHDGIAREVVRGIPVVTLDSAGEPNCFGLRLAPLDDEKPKVDVDYIAECTAYRAAPPSGS